MKISRKDLLDMMLEALEEAPVPAGAGGTTRSQADSRRAADGEKVKAKMNNVKERQRKELADALFAARKEATGGSSDKLISARTAYATFIARNLAADADGTPADRDLRKVMRAHLRKLPYLKAEFDKVKSAPSSPAAPQAQRGSGPKKKKRVPNEKVKTIQQAIDPVAKHTQPDGMWGGGTNTAWKEWVTSPETMAALAKMKSQPKNESLKKYSLLSLLEAPLDATLPAEKANQISAEDKTDLRAFIEKNSGNAAAIAQRFGFKGNVEGVAEFVAAVQKQADDGGEGEEEESVYRDAKPLQGENLAIDKLKLHVRRFERKGNGEIKTRPTLQITSATAHDLTKETSELEDKPPFKGGQLDLETLYDDNTDFYLTTSGKLTLDVDGFDNFLISKFKREGDFVVLDQSAVKQEESLSRGALIRKRYYGRY